MCETGFIRSADLTPLMRRRFELETRIPGLTLCESYSGTGERRTGRHPAALKHRRNAAEFVGGRSGPLDVASRDRDLHLCLQERGAAECRVRWLLLRSEERRVGKECRSGWSRQQ